jgi:hypothetical protein
MQATIPEGQPQDWATKIGGCPLIAVSATIIWATTFSNGMPTAADMFLLKFEISDKNIKILNEYLPEQLYEVAYGLDTRKPERRVVAKRTVHAMTSMLWASMLWLLNLTRSTWLNNQLNQAVHSAVFNCS